MQGWQKTTLIDYPGHIASTFFYGGCNFNCAFCHNPELVKTPQNNQIKEDEVLDYLKTKKHLYEAVCITGGEPTLYPQLLKVIKSIKSIGLKVKLDTNASNYELVKKLTDEKLIDYIAVDIKTSLDKYPLLMNVDNKLKPALLENIQNSLKYIMNSGIDYEFRSTLYPPFFSSDDLKQIGELIKGAKVYYLQQFNPKNVLKNENVKPFTSERVNEIQKFFAVYVKECKVRGLNQ